MMTILLFAFSATLVATFVVWITRPIRSKTFFQPLPPPLGGGYREPDPPQARPPAVWTFERLTVMWRATAPDGRQFWSETGAVWTDGNGYYVALDLEDRIENEFDAFQMRKKISSAT